MTDDRNSEYQNLTYTKYKFDGTEEKFGKTYHRWVVIESESYENKNIYESSEWTYEHNSLNALVALLREEDGKVFMLLDREEIYEYDKDFNPADGWETMGKVLITVTPGEEVILYDFTVSDGEDFNGIIADEVLSPIITVGTEEIENTGETLKMISFVSAWGVYPFMMEWNYPSAEEAMPIYKQLFKISAVEGYGVVDNGTLTDFKEPPTVEPECECWKRTNLNNVYDFNSGSILFKGVDMQVPTAGINEMHKELEESPIYDLFGRKVKNILPGSVYIKDGKKYIGR